MQCGFTPSRTVLNSASQKPAVRVAPLADTFKLHSLPSATKKIYLDFDGHVTTNTIWQKSFGYPTINTPAFSLDANYNAFSDAEQALIQDVWARVAEDFAPFDVDVTTEDPGIDGLTNSGGSDNTWGMRIVVGGDGAWRRGAAGVAVLNSFGAGDGTPCFSFADQWWKNDRNLHSTIISHEIGHTLGLGHDGYNGSEYYGGRGSGATSWGPIMGNPNTSITQWSNGDYGGSTNKQDDLQIITSRNGFGYRADDHGGTTQTATAAPASSFSLAGVVERSTDVDMFRFTTTGDIRATISPLSVGANLDVLATLLDSSGATIATSNPTDRLDASFTMTVAPGTYYLAVRGTGFGNPNTTGYSNYGSLGQYTVTVGSPSGPTPSLSVSDVTVVEGNAGTTSATVTVRLSAAAQAAVTVAVATANGTATVADGDYSATSTTLTFAPGELEKAFSVQVRADTKIEPDETVFVRLSNPTNAIIGDGEGLITISNDDLPPGLAIEDITIVEGNSGTRNANFVVRLSGPLSRPVYVQYATSNGTATSADADYIPLSGTLTFQPGETVKTLIVLIRSDAKVEPNETFSLSLSNASSVPIYKATATATIENDDSAAPPSGSGGTVVLPAVSVSDAKASEGHSGTRTLSFVVSLSRPATELVSVRFRTVGRTATAGSDFVAATGELRFARGMSSQTVQVVIRGDTLQEADETLALELFDARGITLGRPTGIGAIVNDDPAPARLSESALAWASLTEPSSSRRRL